MRVAIVGSRHFSQPERVTGNVKGRPARASLITGSASGVDAAATKAARERGLGVQVMPASFDEMSDASKSAARNQRRPPACGVLGPSGGAPPSASRPTGERALNAGKEVHVFVATTIK